MIFCVALLTYRTVVGLGLGGEFGIGMALAAEAWPARKRARVSSYVGIGWQLGVLAAALVTPILLPRIGWRGLFARLRALRDCAPVLNRSRSLSHTPQTGMQCGAPSGRTDDTQ